MDCPLTEQVGAKSAPLAGWHVVVFSSRAHPGETSSSFVMDGPLEFLLSAHEAALFPWCSLTLLLVPMLRQVDAVNGLCIYLSLHVLQPGAAVCGAGQLSARLRERERQEANDSLCIDR